MKITVVKEFTFDAAHYLPGYKGPCARIHGHTYRLQIGVSGFPDSSGMVLDFVELKKEIQETIISKLDHFLLNEIDFCGFPKHKPTAENMVLWIHDILISRFVRDLKGILAESHLELIRLWETPTSYAEWRAE